MAACARVIMILRSIRKLRIEMTGKPALSSETASSSVGQAVVPVEAHFEADFAGEARGCGDTIPAGCFFD